MPGALDNLAVSQTPPLGVVHTTRQSCVHAAGAGSHSVNLANSYWSFPYTKTLTCRFKKLAIEIMLVYVLKLAGHYFLFRAFA